MTSIPSFNSTSASTGEPQSVKKPQNIFVCSMADLFGEWVPNEWINQVFAACEKAPQHRYIFLTKNPKLYKFFLPKENWHYGTTITGAQNFREKSEEIYLNAKNSFISLEPIQEAIFLYLNTLPKWIIIGAETGNRKGKIAPKKEWIERIAATCKDNGIPLFMKDSLKDIWQAELIRQFPWGAK